MILLLAGTADGREIFAQLVRRGYPVVATVTTAYGAQLLAEERSGGETQILVRALGDRELAALIAEKGITVVVDASHPFAVQASANALRACRVTNAGYVRYERPSCPLPESPLLYRCRDFNEAARRAVSLGETIFLTTGSKTLPGFVAAARRYGRRLVVRVLPDPGVLAGCFALGLKPADVIALQGPIGYELNRALLSAYRAEVLVTKESGPAGGTAEKIAAALDLGVRVVVVERPALAYPLVVNSFADLMQALEALCAKKSTGTRRK